MLSATDIPHNLPPNCCCCGQHVQRVLIRKKNEWNKTDAISGSAASILILFLKTVRRESDIVTDGKSMEDSLLVYCNIYELYRLHRQR